MQFVKELVSTVDIMGDRRKAQFDHERRFDAVQYHEIKEKCGQELAENIVLIRSRINRVLCRSTADAGIFEKATKYGEFLDEIDKFNSNIDRGMIEMNAEHSTSNPNELVKRCSCKTFTEMVQQFNSDPKYVEQTNL